MPTDTVPSATARQLVVCCDGTNNTLTGGEKDTNVLRFVEHLAAHPTPHRLVYYDPGVGTSDAAPPTGLTDWAQRSWERISGLASGRGVYDNIAQGYLFLVKHWRDENDRIYCFGFSRGAFTARCIAGMVNLFGILKPEHEDLLPTLLHIYFSQPAQSATAMQNLVRKLHGAAQGHSVPTAPTHVAASGRVSTAPVDQRQLLAAQVQDLFVSPAGRAAWVHWVGVWDTVESVGLPGPLSRSNPSSATLVGKRMRHVRHALAFDEHRWTFEPRLYEEPDDIDSVAPRQTLKQRWFAGVHCDVGGGYRAAQARLSEEALHWMVDEVAQDMGVPPLAPRQATRVRHDALWDTPWWALAGMCLRDMRPTTAKGALIAVHPGPGQELPSISVWAQRRPLWPLVVALLTGALFLMLSGACLTPMGWRAIPIDGPFAVIEQAAFFAALQLMSLVGAGLLGPDMRPWDIVSHPGWAMFWDLCFVASWGYVLARISSRSFAWLAGRRTPSSPLPWWRVFGMAPLLAVGGDVVEDLSTVLGLAMHGMGIASLADLMLWLAGLASAGKFVGLAGCLFHLAVRLVIALPGVSRSRG